MNRYEYGYMQKLAAINKLATLYNAMKGILRIKLAAKRRPIPSPMHDEIMNADVNGLVRLLNQQNYLRDHPEQPMRPRMTRAEESLAAQRFGQLSPNKGLESYPNEFNQPYTYRPELEQKTTPKPAPSFPGHTPLQGSPKRLDPALAERLQTVKDLGGLDHIRQLQGDNSAVEQIRRTAGQGSVGGSGMTRQDFIDSAAAANERKNQAQAKLQRHKDRVAAATAAQATGNAEVPPTVNNTADSSASSVAPTTAGGSAPPTPPNDNPNKPGFWERHQNWAPNMTAMGLGMTAGGAALGGLGGYGAARGLGLYNDDASTAKRMLGHLLTAGGAVGGGILGNYGSNRLANYLAQRKK